MSASLLSVNGELRSMFEGVNPDQTRSTGYRPVALGRPLFLRYLYFFLRFPKAERRNELLISTFMKTGETREAAAESVTYFAKNVRFDSFRHLRIHDFGGDTAGHPLLYYTRAYLGESLHLTVRVRELDRADAPVLRAVQQGLARASGMPMFAEFLPYLVAAKAGLSVTRGLIELFDRDDPVIEAHRLDLHFDLRHARRLQSGRVVCVPGRAETELLDGRRYRVSADNRLLDARTGNEYAESSYFVFQVDAAAQTQWENYESQLGAASLLRMARPGADGNPIQAAAGLHAAATDQRLMQWMESMTLDADAPEVRDLIRAGFRALSPTGQLLYRDRALALLRGADPMGDVAA